MGGKPYTVTINTPTGWTPIPGAAGVNGSVASGVDTGSVVWAAFYKMWRTGDANVTYSTGGTPSPFLVKQFYFSKATHMLWEEPVGANGSDTSSGTGMSMTMSADVGIQTDDFLLAPAWIAGNDATFATPTLTATSATIGSVTELDEGSSTSGNDLGAAVMTAVCTAGTSSAAAVVGWTLSAAQTGGGCIIRLRERAKIARPPTYANTSIVRAANW
jgi:hypothetical protein